MTARRADLVWEVALAGVRGLRHVELQVKVEADIGERVAEYALRLWRRDHLPVVSVVIFLRPVGHVPEPRFVLPSLGHDRLVDTFTIVRLWEVPQERVLESPEYLLWPLAALMAGTSVETTIAVAERIAATDASLEERRELTGLLVTLAGLRRSSGELLAAVRRNPMVDELLRESSVAEEFIEEGRQEGITEGRVDEARRLARLVLQGRLPSLEPDMLAAIERADATTLEQVVVHAASETVEQIRSRLGLDRD